MDTIEPNVKLSSGILLGDLIGSGTTFDVNFDELNIKNEQTDRTYNAEDMVNYINFDCLGLNDEETYNDGEPFEHLAIKMTNLLENGQIKKRIIREGVGSVLPKQGLVTCDYNAYVEYNEDPFDSTYLRRSQFKFRLDNGEAFPGFDVAVQSMKINEKSQFLIHPDLAYGKMGCLERVPPDSTVLFEIEVKNCIDTGSLATYKKLNEEEQNNFTSVYNYANALCLKGNDLFSRNCFKAAVREYNIAVTKLVGCVLADYQEQEQQQMLLLRLYTNLVVAYMKLEQPRKCCTNCNEIYHMVKGTSLKVPAKVYFNNARALIMLGDFTLAEKRLRIAKTLQPTNTTISEEFLRLDKLKKENRERELALARALLKNTKSDNKNVTRPTESVNQEFKDTLKECFEDLKNKTDITQFILPDDLNEEEIEYIKKETQVFNLEFIEHNGKYSVSKQ